MQTILGAGGAIGVELAKALKQHSSEIRLVSRNPKKINDSDLLFSADLTQKEQIFKAVESSKVCYLTVGFDYNTKVWQERWPVLIDHVLEACAAHEAKLVFFDNVYAIGKEQVHHITEQSPISPTSNKGRVRALVDRKILHAVETGKVEAIIARAPDFFGPIKDKSILMTLVYDNYIKGKAAQWFCKGDMPHTVGYTPDLAKGTAILGNTPSAFNQVWNLPTPMEALTGAAWAALFAEEMQVKNRLQVLPSWALKALGWFIPIMGELHDMAYQFDRPYFFDSSKFKTTFSFVPSTNQQAVHDTLAALKTSTT